MNNKKEQEIEITWYENPILKNLVGLMGARAMRGIMNKFRGNRIFGGKTGLLDVAKELGMRLDNNDKRLLLICYSFTQQFSERIITEFETAEEAFQFFSKDQFEKEWYWLKISKGKFSTGRGLIENPTISVQFKDNELLMKLFNMDIEIPKSVLLGKIKVKPLGKARIIVNFFRLYLEKINLKLVL